VSDIADITPRKPSPEGGSSPLVGVLLVNLGSPDAPTAAAVRRYLRQFLSDPYVITDQGLAWKLVLNGIILPIRPFVKARAYAKIWNWQRSEAPLKTITRAQAEKLERGLRESANTIVVDWAMRYGEPSIAARLDALIASGCERIVVVPLYPQFAAATTTTVTEEVRRSLKGRTAQPAVRIAPAYFDDLVYIEALAASLISTLAAQPVQPEVILASYHGIPKAYVDAGDPYAQQCAETTRLLRERLVVGDDKLVMTFQSRFGRAEWLTPYTDKTVAELARRGVKTLAVITPGFSADCLETLEEIAIENAHIFHRSGGERFIVVPCLNDSEVGMSVIAHLVARELDGWL
jgi:ferrochelatase